MLRYPVKYTSSLFDNYRRVGERAVQGTKLKYFVLCNRNVIYLWELSRYINDSIWARYL